MKILVLGATGADVKILQRQLACLDYLAEITGEFDSETETAVKSFQARTALDDDGEVGDLTHARLDAMVPIGVDISHNDGEVDWANLSPRIQFVYAKATQGHGFLDPAFASHISNARAKKLIYGAYHFLTAANDASVQAENFLSACKAAGIDWSAPGCLPPMLDVEDQVPASLNALITADRAAFVQKVKDFLAIIAQQTGRRPVIYTYKSFTQEYLESSPFDADLWLASYQVPEPGLPVGWATYTIWQWAEDVYPAGLGSCDIDVFHGTAEQLRRYANYN